MTARNCLMAGIAGLLLAGAGWVLEPGVFAGAWAAALTLFLALPVGCLLLLNAHALTGGRWGLATLPGLRLGVATLPLLLPGLVPLLLTLPVLYPWARPGAQLANAFYLNLPFSAGRLAIYLLSWFGLAAIALVRPGWLRATAPLALILLVVTYTFATIDLTMSVDPRFNSSIFGMLALSEAALVALAAATLLGPLDEPAACRQLGQLLLGTVLLWTYLDFMQALIVWESDLPTDAPWYVVRIQGAWGWLDGAVFIGRFLIPFALLLSPRRQRSPRVLRSVAVLLLATQLLRSWWLIVPSTSRPPSWLDAACALAFAGLGAAFALYRAASPAMRHA